MHNPLDPDCICHGNWRAIIKETGPLLGDEYEYTGKYPPEDVGRGWHLYGIVYAEDDFYYGMTRNGVQRLLTCVGSIEDQGFNRVACGHMWRYSRADSFRPMSDTYKCLKCGALEDREQEIA
jgi:predicted RNA-binding Zn-ribbon protein involved in translation (DUF1610 family)